MILVYGLGDLEALGRENVSLRGISPSIRDCMGAIIPPAEAVF